MIYNYADRPNSRVHMDTAGPFPISNGGSVHILVLKCALTKWVVLIPVRFKNMAAILREYLNNWVAHFGAPLVLITDRGTEFHNHIVTELTRIWGCRNITTTPRNPRSDGQVENQMRTIKDMLQHFTSDSPTDWDEYLPLVAQAFHNTISDATGYTPYFLMHGTEMNYPSEEHVERLDSDKFHAMTSRAKDTLQWLWSYIGRRVNDNSQKHNRVPAERLKFKPYKIGDWFFLRVVPKSTYKSRAEQDAIKISSKLQFRYTGPYQVCEVVLPILYRSRIHGVLRTVHAINMKPASRNKMSAVEDTSNRGIENRPTEVLPLAAAAEEGETATQGDLLTQEERDATPPMPNMDDF